MKKKCYFVMGAKGGVGKTIIELLLANYFSSRGINFVAFDADGENRGKSSSFAHAYPHAKDVNLKDVEALDSLLREASENDITLVDLPANASADFIGWFSQIASPETLDYLNLELIAIGVITPEQGTLSSVIEWAQKLQDSCSYWVVLNERVANPAGKAKEALFLEYYGTEIGRQFKQVAKPTEVHIPFLYPGTAAQLARAAMLPHEALEGKKIDFLNGCRLRDWVKKVEVQLEEAID